MNQKQILICDIDGVVADLKHRLHFIQTKPPDWDAFFEACDRDAPMIQIIDFLRQICDRFEIAFITGRPWRTRDKTVAWFRQNYVPWQEGQLLLMRSDGDFRPDHIVKRELFEAWIDPKRVFAVFEDRDAVVSMWREHGLLCFQNQKGDLNELYATLVDPVAEGVIKEAEMRKQLLESTRWYRQRVHDLDGVREKARDFIRDLVDLAESVPSPTDFGCGKPEALARIEKAKEFLK
jgi:hypothetical protein